LSAIVLPKQNGHGKKILLAGGIKGREYQKGVDERQRKGQGKNVST